MSQDINQFNMVIVGTGGQGLITLLRILSEAALLSGYEIRTSELHGLSQRGGSVTVHLCFGEKVYTPMVGQAGADLILGLEMQESLRASDFIGSKTTLLINDLISPIPLQESLPKQAVINELNNLANKVVIVPASEICEKELDANVTAGTYLLAYAAANNLIPISTDIMWKAIESMLNKKYLEINRKAFDLGSNAIIKAHD